MQNEIELNQLNQLINPNAFSYHAYWEQQEPEVNEVKPHQKKARELLGLKVVGVPVSPALTKLKDTKERLEQIYDIAELREEGIDIDEMLAHMTEQQIIEKLEGTGVEPTITPAEIESLLLKQEWQAVLEIPIVRASFCDLRQIEEIAPGKFGDVSAFASADYLRGVKEFNKYRYFTDKVAEKAKDLAIMHSCITDERGKNGIKQRFIALVNNKYRNYALKLLAIHNTTSDEEKRAKLRVKLLKQSRQIRRLKDIWFKHAYSK